MALRARKGQQRRGAARLPLRCRLAAARLRRRQHGLGPRCKGVSGRVIRACVGVWQGRQGTQGRERGPHLSRRPLGRASCGPLGTPCDEQSPGIKAACANRRRRLSSNGAVLSAAPGKGVRSLAARLRAPIQQCKSFEAAGGAASPSPLFPSCSGRREAACRASELLTLLRCAAVAVAETCACCSECMAAHPMH